ncbi:hypothetical protein Patl1_36879 [Pistacia atlantica]|nr:hypothetical protein Patl1_36879 [Pistacia atlantica]
MSHIMFPTSAKTLSSLTPPSLPIPRLGPSQPGSQPTSVKLRRRNLNVTCSASVVDGGESSVAGLERCYTAPSALASSSSVEFGPVMKGGQYGAFGAVTLEKGKLDLTQKQSQSSPEVSCEIEIQFG